MKKPQIEQKRYVDIYSRLDCMCKKIRIKYVKYFELFFWFYSRRVYVPFIQLFKHFRINTIEYGNIASKMCFEYRIKLGEQTN